MPRIRIDNREVEVPAGATVLDAARKLGIEIPTLCHLDGRPALTSCMVCVVKVAGRGWLVPACAFRAEDGMEVESETEPVLRARRAALELLLSDHVGDCEAPCRLACPAGANIPLMIRQIADGRLGEALITARDGLVLPGVLGRICTSPCQRVCRRADADAAVSVRLLHGFLGEAAVASGSPQPPARKEPTGKSVAIVGAGPAGLAAAQRLLADGHACTVFDDHDQPGGMLRYGLDEARLPRDLLDAEIAVIEQLGARFRCGVRVGADVSLRELRDDFGAVFLAPGRLDADQARRLGVEATDKGITIDPATFQTPVPGVFAGGDATRPRKLAVRAVAHGKAAAAGIGQLLAGSPVTAPARPFNSRMGKLDEGELAEFLAGAADYGPVSPAGGQAGLADEQARREARRCLHCDCRKAEDCLLRIHATACGARQQRPPERRRFTRQSGHPTIVFEPGKCISCGMCIRIAADAGEELGLTFVGRGFDMRLAVPFARPLGEGLTKAAAECVKACPTAALAFKADT